jgi:peptidoglycan-N-acetylglucosamine deacetylase
MKKIMLAAMLILAATMTFSAPVSRSLFGRVVGKGESGEKLVALTFDDGPNKVFTPQVLAVLKKYNIRATFFMCGEQANYYPELVKQVSVDGNEVANHSWTHPNLYKNKAMRGAPMAAEVQKTSKLIEKLVMIKPAFFRAPYNYAGKETVQAVNDLGLVYVGWTFSLLDWEKPAPQKMVDMFNRKLMPGTILLLHDGGGNRTNTVAALPGIIEAAKKKGYRFVTLGEMLK